MNNLKGKYERDYYNFNLNLPFVRGLKKKTSIHLMNDVFANR